jgi:hypothetical protein
MSDSTPPLSESAAAGPPSRDPYGPQTTAIRRFLVQFAGLGADARAEVMRRHHAAVDSREYVAAESLVGETIARAGRTDARDALAGPLLQLVRTAQTAAPDDDVLSMLDPIAEPALAALLALLVADLVPPATLAVLYQPFGSVIPLADGDHRP